MHAHRFIRRDKATTTPDTTGMQRLGGGRFVMGSDGFYPEEAPKRRVKVDPFWIDETPVTNAAFSRFVAETGYRTEAETAPDPSDYPGILIEQAQPGSLVFQDPSGLVGLSDFRQWWAFVPGAQWRHPTGPGSTIDNLDNHPVVQVSFADARAYARWAGKTLPTEAEWEYAARGGLDDADYSWGDTLAPDGKMLANYWQGAFPTENLLLDGYARTSPVGSYPANGFGLLDLIGNVWEWTSDWYAEPVAIKKSAGSCCIISNPRGARKGDSLADGIGRKVLKGGSHLCAQNYCRRYRPAARQGQTIESSATHIGFRCIVRSAEPR